MRKIIVRPVRLPHESSDIGGYIVILVSIHESVHLYCRSLYSQLVIGYIHGSYLSQCHSQFDNGNFAVSRLSSILRHDVIVSDAGVLETIELQGFVAC